MKTMKGKSTKATKCQDNLHPAAVERGWDFTLILTGVADVTDGGVMDALYEAGCDDGSPGASCGVAHIDFTRQALSLKDAILSAIVDVRKSNTGIDVVRVDESDLVTKAEMARR